MSNSSSAAGSAAPITNGGGVPNAVGTMGISPATIQGMSGQALPPPSGVAQTGGTQAPAQSGLSQWLTGTQTSPQQMSKFISDPNNKDLLNSYTMLNMTGHGQAANQLMQGTPLAQNTGGALGSLSRVLTGQTQDPVEGMLHLGLAGGLDLLRRQSQLNFMRNEPNMMNNMSNQMLANQQQQSVAKY